MTNVVIGAGSGMGVEVARQLAPRGPLVIADVKPDGVEQRAAELGGDVRAATCDVTDQTQVDALFADIDSVDALVQTAGISGPMYPGRLILDVNLRGPARVLQAAEPKLHEGSVAVVVASQSGYLVPENAALFAVLVEPLAPDFFERLGEFFDIDSSTLAYHMSKRGVHQLVRHKAASWGAKGARIMSVSPGINDTPMNAVLEELNPIMLDIIKNSPLGRRGTPQEIANVISFVTSDQASLLTGSDVLADGGMCSVLPASWEGKLRTPSSS